MTLPVCEHLDTSQPQRAGIAREGLDARAIFPSPSARGGIISLDIPFYRTQASASQDPLGDFYQGLLAGGVKPPMARLTLARKIAAIALTIWKKGEGFDPAQLKRQAA